MHDGKLYLSLNDAIALALENNLDIAIARYNLNIADTDVLRARAGASILGVNAGVVLNTPGGGVGGIGGNSGASTGGTSLGAGGIGAGTNGLVSSTLGFGPVINSFDPVLTGTLQEDRFNILPSSTFSPASPQNTTTGNFAYQQAFSWGTNLSVGFNNTRVAVGDAPFSALSPAAQLQFQVSGLPSTCCRELALQPTRASSALPRTIANCRTWPSVCKLLIASIRSKTSIGTWSTPTKTRACRTSHWLSRRRLFPIPRSKWRSVVSLPLKPCALRALSLRTSNL